MKFRATAILFAGIFIFTNALWSQDITGYFSLKPILPGDVHIRQPLSAEPDSIPPDSTDMRSITSVELAEEMIPGWNVGNSLEAIGGETAWGNPLITQRLIDSVKAVGFNAVRIPVAWSNFAVDSNFTIEQAWLERVEEVVWYVLVNGMYAIINEHWDNGWLQPTYADSAYCKNRLATMWRQIAVHFRDYDDHLLFAGTNEVHVEGNWGAPTKENYTVQNMYNQVFVNTVRATGGRNYYRHLVVQGYVTNIDYTMNYFVIPKDVVPNRMVVEVHYYDPYNFTLNETSNITQWGKYATNSSKTETWANESYADNQFNKMKTKFIDNGYAVILGEYGAISRLNLGSEALNAEHAWYRRYYTNYITYSLVKHGLVPFYWDNGYKGNHSFAIFDRATGSVFDPDILSAIIAGADTTILAIDTKDNVSQPQAFTLNQNYPNPFNATTMISYLIPENNSVSLVVYDLEGREVAVLERAVMKNAGNYRITFKAGDLPSGVYICKLIIANQNQTRKMLLLK